MNLRTSIPMQKAIKAFIFVFMMVAILPLKSFAQACILRGVVTNANTHLPLSDVRVMTDTFICITNSAGEYLFGDLNTGTYDIWFTKRFYQDTTQFGVVVVPTRITVLDMEMSQSNDALVPLNTFELTFPGATRGAIKGNYLFLNSDAYGMQIIDIYIADSTHADGWLPYITYPVQDLDLRGEYAYLSAGTIHIGNISDIHHPYMINQDIMNGYGKGIFVRGHYAYVGAGSYFYVYDISNLGDLHIAGYLEGDHDFGHLAVCGNYAYVADPSDGLIIIDVSNPEAPALMATYYNWRCNSVFLRGNYIYLASGYLNIIDISSPANPQLAGSIYVAPLGAAAVVQGDYTYFAGGDLYIINTSDPTAPFVSYRYDLGGGIEWISVSNNLIYAVDYYSLYTLRFAGLPTGNIEGFIGDLNNNPIAGARIAVANTSVETWTDENGQYMLDNIFTGPCSLDFSSPGFIDAGVVCSVYVNQTTELNLNLDPNCMITGHVRDFFGNPIRYVLAKISGKDNFSQSDVLGYYELSGIGPGNYDLIFSHPSYHDSIFHNITVARGETTTFDAHLRISTEIELIGSCGLEGNAFGITVKGDNNPSDYLFVASNTAGMQIIDISDPSSPVVVSRYSTADTAWEISVQGFLAYVAEGNAGLEIVNVTDPQSPTHIGNYQGLAAYSIDVQGSYAYELEGEWYEDGYLKVLNISNPIEPLVIGSYALPHYLGDKKHVRVRGDYAYVNFSDMFMIINVSDPSNPYLQGFINNFMGWQIEGQFIEGNYAFVTEHDRELFRVIDISDPSNPIHAGVFYDLVQRPFNIWVQNGFAYMANYTAGIKILDIANNITFPTLAAEYDIHGPAYSVLASGEYVYTANDSSLMVLRFNGTGRVTGIVRDDSVAISNVVVGVVGWPLSDTTDSQGNFQFNAVHQGVRTFSFSHPSYSDTVVQADVVIGNTTDIDMTLHSPTGIDPEESQLPVRFMLRQNYPNPFNPATTITYSLPVASAVKLSVYDILGRKVTTLLNGPQPAGEHKVVWNASAFPSGLYFARLETGEKSQTVKMILLK